MSNFEYFNAAAKRGTKSIGGEYISVAYLPSSICYPERYKARILSERNDDAVILGRRGFESDLRRQIHECWILGGSVC